VAEPIQKPRAQNQDEERRQPERLLIVEDDAAARVGLQQLIRKWGFVVETAVDGSEALDKIPSFNPGIVLTDLVMPRMGGLELLRALREQGEGVTTVVLTAQGTVDTAVEAIKQGAYDYLTKPVDLHRLRVLLDKIAERQETLREMHALRQQLREHGAFGSMIGGSPEMQQVYRIIEQAAPTSASVLVVGESGTGKELVAQTIHRLSPRKPAPYVPINCAAIPETLLESELFGHEKGAFTGAVERRQGCFELADRGTLFLDEIAEMMPATQVKLLRVLQERTVRRLGGTQEKAVDIRVIAATNADPAAAVRDGRLREDLYYRLNVFEIRLPPLRNRKGDLPLLVQAFIDEFNTRNNRSVAGVDAAVMRLFEDHSWPGNVRELRNVIERATIVAAGPAIGVKDLPPLVGNDRATRSAAMLTPGTTVEQAERALIVMTLEHTKGNKTHAAEMLGISLKTLHNKLHSMKESKEPQHDAP
jgi:DNA-binding NtrC family response regulator